MELTSSSSLLSRNSSYSPILDGSSSYPGTGYDTHQTSNRYSHHSGSSTPRQPLGESTGNSQPSYFSSGSHNPSSALCNQQPLPTTSTCSIPTPTYTSLGLSIPAASNIVPTQIHGGYDLTTLHSSSAPPVGPSGYGAPGYPGGLRHRRDTMRCTRAAARRIGVPYMNLHFLNPIYHSSQFQQYRLKQESREDKEGQKWTDNLEGWFLDAILLMPHMGRRKFTLGGTQHGRNMLIMEYLWIAYCGSLPPGEAPDKNMRRERKQVSSHIQVLKNFFLSHRCFHFFFPASEKEKGSSDKNTPGELESFKNNPVLTALSESRLPDVKPNYEYFARLLASDKRIAVRPKTVWVYVSNPDVRMDEQGNAYAPSGAMFDPVLFPHLKENLKPEREYEAHLGPRSPNGNRRDTILHEYMKSVEQTTSTSIRDLADRIEEDFCDLSESFNTYIQQEHALNASNPVRHCEILHFKSTVELPRAEACLPPASTLSCITEVTVQTPELQGHAWKCTTMIQRPAKLCGEGEKCVERIVSDVGTQFTHGPGCEAGLPGAVGMCDCAITRRSADIKVPFPVHQWVSILSNAAKYVDVEAGDDDSETARGRGQSTESEAASQLRQVCMLQELISQDPNGPPGPKGVPGWTRRAILVWTFESTVHLDDKGKSVTETPGTNWRFLTLLDPIDQYHQQNVYISSTQAAAAAGPLGMIPSSSASSPAMSSVIPDRNSMLSPAPAYPSIIPDGYGNVWESAASTPSVLPSLPSVNHPYGHPGNLSVPSSSHGTNTPGYGGLDFGLATPPPSASSMSYVGSFDASLGLPAISNGPASASSFSSSQHHDMNNMSYMSNGTIPTSVDDSFMSTVASTDGLDHVGTYEEPPPECDPALSWDSTAGDSSITGLDNTWYTPHEIPQASAHAGNSQSHHGDYHHPSHSLTPVESSSQATYFASQDALDMALTTVTDVEEGKENAATQNIWSPPAVVHTPNNSSGDFSAAGWTPEKEDEIDSKAWLQVPLSSPGGKLEFSLSPLKAAVQARSPPPAVAAGGSSEESNGDIYAMQTLTQLNYPHHQQEGSQGQQQHHHHTTTPVSGDSESAWVMVQSHADA